MTTASMIIISASGSISYIIYKMLVSHSKAELKTLNKELVEIYATRNKQKDMIIELSNSYYNNLSEGSQRALNEINNIIKSVDSVIKTAETALKSESYFKIKKAVKVVSKFNKKSKESAKNLDQKIKNTWEATTQKLINMIADEISSSSAEHKALGYSVPKARIFKKPTELALKELKSLLS